MKEQIALFSSELFTVGYIKICSIFSHRSNTFPSLSLKSLDFHSDANAFIQVFYKTLRTYKNRPSAR